MFHQKQTTAVHNAFKTVIILSASVNLISKQVSKLQNVCIITKTLQGDVQNLSIINYQHIVRNALDDQQMRQQNCTKLLPYITDKNYPLTTQIRPLNETNSQTIESYLHQSWIR